MAVPQSFRISLNGNIYQIQLYWNNVNQYWIMNILSSSGSPILQGIPLVTGCLLLSQFPYLGFPGDLFVQTANNPDEVPTFSGFGTSSQFYYVEGMGAGA